MRFRALSYSTGILLILNTNSANSFQLEPPSGRSKVVAPTFASPQRRPRRSLEKRRRRPRRGTDDGTNDSNPTDDFPWDSAESRPLVFSKKKELGEDYWVDEEEMKRYQARLEEQKRRDPGQMPEDKLWIEILSPYKNNWIGLISVSIVALAFIFKFFPEVISPPMIVNIPIDI